MKIITINKTHQKHLAEVTREMQTRGAPTIKAVWMEVFDAYAALEGSHRIAAAHALGLTPEIEEIEYSDSLVSEVGCDDGGYDDLTIAMLCDSAWERSNLTYIFDL